MPTEADLHFVILPLWSPRTLVHKQMLHALAYHEAILQNWIHLLNNIYMMLGNTISAAVSFSERMNVLNFDFNLYDNTVESNERVDASCKSGLQNRLSRISTQGSRYLIRYQLSTFFTSHVKIKFPHNVFA